jgi:hypothetical protein
MSKIKTGFFRSFWTNDTKKKLNTIEIGDTVSFTFASTYYHGLVIDLLSNGDYVIKITNIFGKQLYMLGVIVTKDIEKLETDGYNIIKKNDPLNPIWPRS